MSKGGPHIGGPKGWSGEHTKRSAVRSHGTPRRRRRARCEDAERPFRLRMAVAGGARSARAVGEAARSKPNEQGRAASELCERSGTTIANLEVRLLPCPPACQKDFFDKLKDGFGNAQTPFPLRAVWEGSILRIATRGKMGYNKRNERVWRLLARGRCGDVPRGRKAFVGRNGVSGLRAGLRRRSRSRRYRRMLPRWLGAIRRFPRRCPWWKTMARARG